MNRFRVLALVALAAGLVLAAGDSRAQLRPAGPQPVQPFPGQPLPGPGVIVGGELPVVPKSSAAFVSVKVSALVDHPDLKPLLEQLKKAPEGLDGFHEMLGVSPHEIDRVTLFWPALAADRWVGEPVLVVTTREPFNEARVLKSLKAEPVFGRDWQHDRGGRGGAGAPAFDRHDHGVKEAVPVKGPEPPPLSQPRLEPLSKPGGGPPKSGGPKPPAEEDSGPTVPISLVVDEPLFYAFERGPFGLLFLADERTLVFLTRDFIQGTTHLALLAQLMQKKANGPLAEAIAAAGGHTFAAGIHLTPVLRAFDRRLPPELAPYAALLGTRTAVVTGSLDKSAKLSLTLTFDDIAAARRAAPVLEEGMKMLAAKAAEGAAEMKASRRPQEQAAAPILEAFAAGLRNATARANGSAVVAAGEVEVGPAAGKAVAGLIESLATRKKFIARTNNLKQIGLALHAFHDVNGKLPTNVYNAKGEAILSWRVHLLPYLEYENLYRQFKMDEPWDSENNKRLVEPMPKVYEVPGREAPRGKTYFQGFVSPDPRKAKAGNQAWLQSWLVEGEKNGRNLAGIPDGSSNTIAVVEARDAVVWSKPDDLPFGEKLPPLGEERADRFAALMFDGSVRSLPTDIDAHILRALVTVAGGEVVADDFDQPRRPLPGGNVPKDAPPGAGGVAPKERIKEVRREIDELRREMDREGRASIERLRAEIDRARAEADLRSTEVERLAKLVEAGAAKREELLKSRLELDGSLARLRERGLELEKLTRELEAKKPEPLRPERK
jgi:hypothetical protein